MERFFLVFAFISFLLLGISLMYLLESDDDESGCASGNRRTAQERDLYVRGQIHFLSMDYGMSNCWNHTVKRFLHLACPSLPEDTGTLETEMVALLTGCFCESQGTRAPLCRKRELWEDDGAYNGYLVDCIKETCFNHNGIDAYDTISSRMTDLCYYYEQELMDTNPDMTRMNSMEDNDLVEMKNYVSGESGERTSLRSLEKLAMDKLKEQKKGLKRQIYNFFADFWYLLDDVMFHLGIGKYADPATYL